MSTATVAVSRSGLGAKQLGWLGAALGAVAWYITLPPLLVRTPVPSIVLGVAAVAAGVAATRGGEVRWGRGAILAGVAGASAPWWRPSRARPTWRRSSSGRRCSPPPCDSPPRCCSPRSAG